MEQILYDSVGGSLREHAEPDLVPCHFTAAMADSWASPAEPCSLTDTLVRHNVMNKCEKNSFL